MRRAGPAEIQRPPTDPVEQGQVEIGVAGHPDQIRHREQGAAGGDGVPGLGLQVLDGGGDDHGDGQAAVGTQLGGAQLGAD